MRETMIKVIAEDLTPYLSSITVPTDLFWGEEDTMTPLADGELMNKKIVQSELHVFSGVRHRVHIERAKQIAEMVVSSRVF
jgi:pimeloyl-ACP methyl ester carboxylesterase